jgi:hypothetical protein
MIELNPHRQTARIIAFLLYMFAGLMIVVGIFFTVASALVDVPTPGLEGVTNLGMAFMSASFFLVIAVMVALLGWRIQRLFGQHRLQEKLAAKSAAGCLKLGSLGCALWGLLATSITIITSKRMVTNEAANLTDLFVGPSGFILIIIIMLAIAGFISRNYTILTIEDRRRIFDAYKADIRSRLPLTEAESDTRAYVQERTLEVLEKLDVSLKGALLKFLSESGLLSGPTRIALRNADFRGIDLRSNSLPSADLHEINLEQATLQGAILFEANLSKANLRQANLSRINLQGSNLRQADLTGTILEGANLSGADLTEANVTLVQLKQAYLKETFLPDGKVTN